MNKTRLEAFSDGVFAIVITLLILDIRLPEVNYDQLSQALLDIMPKIGAYVMSFFVIGLYWVSHHQSSRLVNKTDRVFLWMNILLLLFVSFIPFPTSLLGKFPFRTIPLMIYGINLIVANVTGFAMLLYLYRHPHLASAEFTKEEFRRQVMVYFFVNLFYVLAVVIALFVPVISYIIYVSVLFGLIVIYSRRLR